MVVCYPSTPKKLAATVACFLGGAALFAVGSHISYKNVAPQQARIKARNDFVRDRLRKKYGYTKGGAIEERIKEAHRRVMIANHPDAGGSHYLASKLYEAKDVVIGRTNLVAS